MDIYLHISRGSDYSFSDNFNASTGAAYTAAAGPIGSSTTWSLSRSGVDWGGKIDVGVMDLSNDVSASANVNGWTFGYTPTASFTAPYTTTLNANTSTVTWYFNMQQIRANPAGFTAGSYGVAFVLGGTSTTANNTGDGYAVVLGNTGAVDPVRLVKYTGGLITLGTTLPPTANDLIVSNTGLTTFGTEYLSVKVTYVPSTNTWSFS
ncbi:MAG: hypothetical protein IPP93_11635 [Chitinophagaceae bacterium]|nr:hypothetical protein [Chitinophagaceae bacterium]